ncbi:DNA topoisomerase 2-binding protein 1 [Culicoides brevitarsis]|uniref:DNA topoisomerase 2-binding protein 1 n=1 Tax=Culicoides brevitarsis TaxID=469753 RepID=UPI00307C9F52
MLKNFKRFSIHRKDDQKILTTCEENELKFIFVLPDDCNGDIESAPQNLCEAFKHWTKTFEKSSILSDTAALNLTPSEVNHNEIYIFSNTESQSFAYLKGLGALILGARCILDCFANNMPVPISSSPILAVSMNGIVVSISGPTGEQREEIKMLIGYMGGVCYDDLNASCTHLVASHVTSEKYEIAAKRKLKIMHFGWIYDLWKASCERNVRADDEEFDKHRLPIFYPLCVTSTGLTTKAREKVKNLINANGGTYEGAFSSERTHILILEMASKNSPKFLTACKYKKECLTPQWVFDSVEQGYALSFEPYRVSSMRVSTPTKDFNQVPSSEFNPNSTTLSDISHVDTTKTGSITINETTNQSRMSSFSKTISSRTTKSTESRLSEKSYKATLEKLSLSIAKRSTGFLDGCKVYLSGFDNDSKDKLVKFLNYGGAIRYNELSDQITHVIVGEYDSSDMIEIQSKNLHPHIVTLDWVVESLAAKEPVASEKFLYKKLSKDTQEPSLPSPASKKAILSMNHSFKRPVVPPKLNLAPTNQAEESNDTGKVKKSVESTSKDQTDAESNFVKQYLCQQEKPLNAPEVKLDTNIDTEDLEELNYLADKTVFLFGFAGETLESLILDCEQAKACIVDELFTGVVDYVITPVILPQVEIPVKYKQMVSESFIETAILENKIPEKLEYYHYPIKYSESDPKPLTGDVVSFSIYSGCERIFISSMAELLGAKEEEKFYKKLNPILIVPRPEGVKYEAAMKWGLTAITAEWLIKCFETKMRQPFDEYLVGRENKSDTTLKNVEENQEEMTKNVEMENVKEKNEEDYVLKNPRLSELQKNSTNKDKMESSNISGNISDLDLDTPAKALVKNLLRDEAVKETPNTKRLKLCIQSAGPKSSNTPKVPKCILTPNNMYSRQLDDTPDTRHSNKRKLDVLDTYYMPSKDRRKSTPFSDVRKQFWKSALGEEDIEAGSSENLSKTSTENKTPLSTKGLQKVIKHFGPKSLTKDAESSSSIENHNISFNENEPKDDKNEEDDGLSKVANLIKSRSEKSKSSTKMPPPKRTLEMPLCQVNSEILNGESQDIEVGWKTRRSVQIKKFMFTSMNDEDKLRYMKIVEQLGAENLNMSTGFDDACTHLIFSRPNRGEKVMAAISAGKWCLMPSYLEDCLAAGKFLNEENYEWGNPAAQKSTINLAETELNVAKSCYNWRSKIASTRIAGAFHKFVVILHVANREAFKRIIKAGGGKVLEISEPYHTNEAAKEATHCFIDAKNCTLTDTDVAFLREAGVQVLLINYINAYLNNENINTEKFSIKIKSPTV